MQGFVKEFIQKTLELKAEPGVEVPTVASYGHYSSNVAMQLAKERGVNPRDLAQDFIASLQVADKDGVFTNIELAGPGFINFWLSSDWLREQLVKKYGKKIDGVNVGKKEQVIVEYSSINIAKRMHVGHLRTTIIGDALANIHEYLGYKVTRWNYLGDWGTQFGKLIAAYKLWGDKEEVAQAPIESLLTLYVKFHDEAKQGPTLEDKGRAEFKKLEDGDSENRKLWQWFKEETLKEVSVIYRRLGVDFDVDIGEAFYEKALQSIIKDLKKKGIAQESEGAIIVPLEEFNLPPALIQKSDGATLYLTRDIANLEYRLKKYKPSKILIVVGNEQSLHFRQLGAISQLMGLNSSELRHVSYGLILGADGKKFSTREGGVVSIEELLDKAVEMAYGVVSQKNPDLPEEERRQVAEAVGVGALKYNDLRENRNSDIIFDWDQMLNLAGNTAPYLQYTVARLRSILRKSQIPSTKFQIKKANLKLLDQEIELALMKKMLDFDDSVIVSAQQYMTSHLATYLHELSQMANQYYEQVHVLADENEERKLARLAFVDRVAAVLTKGLELLGIDVPERI